MIRAILEAVALFLVPFVAYAAVLALRRRYPFVLKAWIEGPLAVLVVTGLTLAILGTLAVGFLGGRHLGAYVPAHIENGRLVPGRLD